MGKPACSAFNCQVFHQHPLNILAAIFILTLAGAGRCDINSGLAGSRTNYVRDLDIITSWNNNQLSKVITFTANSEINKSGKTLEVLNFEAGASADIDTANTDTGAFRNLNTTIFNPPPDGLAPDRISMVNLLLYGKTGTGKNMDLGIKLGGLNIENPAGQFSFKNLVGGTDIRRNVPELGFDILDTLCAVALNTVNGSMEIKSFALNNSRAVTDTVSSSITYTLNTNSNTDIKTSWSFVSASFRVIFSKEILFIRPHVGLQADINFGNVRSNYASSGFFQITQVGNPSNTAQSIFSLSGNNSVSVPQANLRFLYGLEAGLTPLIKFWLSGENSNGNNETMLGVYTKF